ncbi:MAG: hypothetical protein LCH99_31975 [Proteobacteria bacterium]|nr:hypothetical protein [Pseudomonadota bacterium]
MRAAKYAARPVLTAAILGVSLLGATFARADEPRAPMIRHHAAPAATAAPVKAPAVTAAPTTAKPAAVVAPIKAADGSTMRTVVVEWKIKKGREQEFIDYWATRSTIPNRDGLIAEFLSTVDSKDKWPWINWAGPIDKPGVTTFYNVGLWRDGESFQDQIGKFIDNNRPPLDFEAERRTRVFLAPQRWRVGETALPRKDSDGTK